MPKQLVRRRESSAVTTEDGSEPCQSRRLVRLVATGWEERTNDLLISYPESVSNHVLFFPGDVQDFAGDMASEITREFLSFSYEKVVELLISHFGSDSAIWVVRPSRFQSGVYSCFDNFVECNQYGAVSEFCTSGCASKHLMLLMDDASQQMGIATELNIPINLVGFSKGGIVLSQLVTELGAHSSPGDSVEELGATAIREMASKDCSRAFFSNVHTVHWLDPGNGSREGVYPTEADALRELCEMEIQVFVHVTPYQYQSSIRTWIQGEADEFVRRIEILNGHSHLICYYHNDGTWSHTVDAHFQLLEDFDARVCFRTKADSCAASLVQPFSPASHYQPVRKRLRVDSPQ